MALVSGIGARTGRTFREVLGMDRVTLGFEVMAARHRAQRRAESVRRMVTEAQARGVSVVVALLPDDGGA